MIPIAITQRTQCDENTGEVRDALDQRWLQLCSACELMPVVVPNHVELASQLLARVEIKGVILTGGNDSASRNAVENLLLEIAIKRRIPVLGVCHGMQAIQSYFGLSLVSVDGHVAPSQEIMIGDESVTVNSYHEKGTTETTHDLIVWARAKDQTIKAIRHHELPIVGIMWHPERFEPFRLRDQQFIKKIFSGELACAPSY